MESGAGARGAAQNRSATAAARAGAPGVCARITSGIAASRRTAVRPVMAAKCSAAAPPARLDRTTAAATFTRHHFTILPERSMRLTVIARVLLAALLAMPAAAAAAQQPTAHDWAARFNALA